MSRKAQHKRKTKETEISLQLEIDGRGQYEVQTPIGFLTHMVEQISRHGLFDLKLKAKGDTHIDGHHTTEDLGIALGQAFKAALGDKSGIRRYGSATLPMDEACVTCALDLSGRPFVVFIATSVSYTEVSCVTTVQCSSRRMISSTFMSLRPRLPPGW